MLSVSLSCLLVVFAEIDGSGSRSLLNSLSAAPANITSSIADQRRRQYPGPQVQHLIPFDPQRPPLDRAFLYHRYGPLSDLLCTTLMRTPPPDRWIGPLYIIEQVCALLSRPYPERDVWIQMKNPAEIETEQTTTSAQIQSSSGEKRKREDESVVDDDNSTSDVPSVRSIDTVIAPSNDLFRQRRQQKLAKQGTV